MNMRNFYPLLHDSSSYTVHTGGEKMAQEVSQVKGIIDDYECEAILPEFLVESCLRVGVYYAFYVRDKKLALNYLEKILPSCEPGTLEYAQIYNFIGYANTIDPDYKDMTYFQKAIQALIAIEKTSNLNSNADLDYEIRLGKAFAERYLGLLLHRKNNPDDLEDILDHINAAIDTHRYFTNLRPLVAIDLAESLHIRGVIMARNKNLQEAEKMLNEAAYYENQFCKTTGAMHFLCFITKQSQADVLVRLGKGQEAITLLEEILPEQIKFHQTEVHMDIAKTLHFLGNAYASTGQYENALKQYQQALNVKKQLYPDHAPMIKVTQDAIDDMRRKIQDQQALNQTTLPRFSVLNSAPISAAELPTLVGERKSSP